MTDCDLTTICFTEYAIVPPNHYVFDNGIAKHCNKIQVQIRGEVSIISTGKRYVNIQRRWGMGGGGDVNTISTNVDWYLGADPSIFRLKQGGGKWCR